MSRAELVKLKRKADDKYLKGDSDARHVIDAINNATPADFYILFMGFCPGADLIPSGKKKEFVDLIITKASIK